ncbi:MAG: hypothetical protein ABIL09_30245 [Gemmatimonadota bacterium]
MGLLAGLAGCGYYHYAAPLRPLADQREAAMQVADDGSVVFARGRFTVSLRPMSDQELNRQFASRSEAGARSTNPYTFGDVRFWEGERERARFTVFRLRVTNGEYPKVKIDPARIVLRADNGREYWSLGLPQLDNYYRAYATGYQGNEYARYRERIDILRRTMFRNEEVFNGQEVEGFVIFPALDHDAQQLQAVVHDAVLRFDYRNEPVETVELTYHFGRDTGRIYRDGRVVRARGVRSPAPGPASRQAATVN